MRHPVYAGIGNLDAPVEAVRDGMRLAFHLSTLGFDLRTGGASGMDSAFYRGHTGGGTRYQFLPWPGFRKIKAKDGLDSPSSPALYLASKIYPDWGKVTTQTKMLMARNLDIVAEIKLIKPLERPSSVKVLRHHFSADPVDLVVCYERSGVSRVEKFRRGGTNFALYALTVMEMHGIIQKVPPTFNLKDPAKEIELMAWMEDYTRRMTS